jgi:hypothetical protein
VSAWDVAGIVGVVGGIAAAVAVVLVLARLLAAVASLDRTTRDLVRSIDDVRRTRLPGRNGAGVAASDGVGEDGLHPAPSSGGTADGQARLRVFDLRLVSPVIKARALGRGTSEAARQFRERREH